MTSKCSTSFSSMATFCAVDFVVGAARRGPIPIRRILVRGGRMCIWSSFEAVPPFLDQIIVMPIITATHKNLWSCDRFKW